MYKCICQRIRVLLFDEKNASSYLITISVSRRERTADFVVNFNTPNTGSKACCGRDTIGNTIDGFNLWLATTWHFFEGVDFPTVNRAQFTTVKSFFCLGSECKFDQPGAFAKGYSNGTKSLNGVKYVL